MAYSDFTLTGLTQLSHAIAKPNPAKGMSKSATSAGSERFSRSGGGVARRNNLSLSRVVGKVGG